jgi:phospholipid transport system substrate-binding protein
MDRLNKSNCRTFQKACVVVMALALLAPLGLSKSYAMNAAEGYVHKLSNSVLHAANSGQKARFRSLMRRHADIRTIGMFSLGQYARKLPAQQRGQYYRLVENWIAKTFISYSRGLNGQKFKVLGSSQRGKRIVLVKSKIVGGGGAAVKWRLTRTNGGYRVSDVNISGVWLSILMKSKFVAKLSRHNGDFNKLFTYLR